MKHYLLKLAVFIGLLTIGAYVAYAQDYTPLAPLPVGTGGATPATYTMSTYLSGMIKLLIALGAVTSILMAIIGGTQYVASGIAPSAKDDAKGRIQNAFIGLALILASYLILNSISPNLVQFNFGLPKIGVLPGTGTADVSVGTGTAVCTNCVPPNSSIPMKAPGQGCALPGPCTVSPLIAGKLETLANVLSAENVGWQISEAWPPTRPHRAECQNPGPKAGTCVDASLSSKTPTNINKFTETATNNGLRAVYEVPNEARRQALIDSGATARIIVVEGITGEHFSVYNN